MALEDKVAQFLDKSDDGNDVHVKDDAPQEPDPQYRMVADAKIPVSKKHGSIWQSRKKAAWKKLEETGAISRWETAIDYYRADQVTLRERQPGVDESSRSRMTTTNKESENLVFANTSALVPAVYAKNPRVEVNIRRNDMKDYATMLERLTNTLISKKAAPGINLKPVARRCVVMSTLTNYAYVEVGYTRKEDASETTLAELNTLAEELAKTKSKKKIAEIEGKLTALEEKVDLLRPSGPWVKFRHPTHVLFDPDADCLDDARWCMIGDYLDTEFLKVVYGSSNEDGKYESLYEPSHVLKVSQNEGISADDEIANFSIFDTSGDRTYKDYGFTDEESFRKAQRTKVWYVWDKATRRVYLYNDKDWKWPLWVWDDPCQYDNFFPVVELAFYIDPSEYHARSEVTYYIDQQDAINKINNEVAKVRDYVVGKILYNKTVFGDDSERLIEAFIEGTNTTGSKRALGIKVPADTDMTKALVPFVPQSAHMLNTVVFDKEKSVQAIDRVSSVTNVMRGVEYKTNTTNKAIDSYESNTQTRLDEKIDQVEEFIGDVAWKVLQSCLRNMTADEVGALIGDEFKQPWEECKQRISDLMPFIDISVVGGSALKANSTAKKNQAAQLGQILGQFARGTPAAILVALKVMQEAYDEVIITKEDWDLIMQGIQASMQQQQGGGGQEQSQQQSQQQEGESGQNTLLQVEQLIDSLPADAKKEFAKMIASDIPIKTALAQIVALMKQAGMQ